MTSRRALNYAFTTALPRWHTSIPKTHALVHNRPLHVRTRAKLQIEVITLFKRSGKDAVFDATISDLTQRMSPIQTVTSRWVRPDRAQATLETLATRTPLILLDSKGALPKNSEHFAQILYSTLESGGSRLCFIIGGPEGLPDSVRALQGGNVKILSLSPLTLTHKMTRLFLYEQLYRATQIRLNSPYHK